MKNMKDLPPETANPEPFKPGNRSPLRALPMGDDPKYIRVDPAHTYAIDGIGKDFIASSIIILARVNHFGMSTIGRCLENAYANFLAYLSAHKKSTSISEFGYGTFKLPPNSSLA